MITLQGNHQLATGLTSCHFLECSLYLVGLQSAAQSAYQRRTGQNLPALGCGCIGQRKSARLQPAFSRRFLETFCGWVVPWFRS
jgi:hypothetical protein